jgi:uncharacterized membrane protein
MSSIENDPIVPCYFSIIGFTVYLSLFLVGFHLLNFWYCVVIFLFITDSLIFFFFFLKEQDVLACQSNQILTAIVHGMRQSETSNHVRLAATTALLNSLEFTSANFQQEVSFFWFKTFDSLSFPLQQIKLLATLLKVCYMQS